MQQKSELPEGWIATAIGEICSISDRDHKTPKYQERGYPLISPKVFTKNGIDFSSSKYVGDDELIAFEKKCNPEIDDILYSRIGTIGEARLLDFSKKFVALHSLALIKPSVELKKTRFVYYFLQSELAKKQAFDGIKSIGVPDLGLSKLNTMVIPLPPVPEQHRIVSAMEALFARLDATNEKLDRVTEILKKFRQSVLAAAFEGRLTEEWRVKCADEKSIKCNWRNINEIGAVSGGLTKNQKRLNYSTKLPYLRVANVYANRLELDEMKEIGVHEDEIKRYSLEEGDLLVVEGNGSIDQIGRVALWDGSIKPCLHQNHIIKVRFSHDVYNKYVLYWLLSPIGRENITSSASSTSGLNTLSISKVGKLPVPSPSLTEQHEIVKRIDALLALADSIEAKVAAAREKTEKLRQSILAKAFSGELVETEAEIARREGRDYESAEVLLERIKKEKGKNGKKTIDLTQF